MSLVSWVPRAGRWFRLARNPSSFDCLPCSICHKFVRLEVSNADELGKAVHEECYVLKIRKQTGQFFTLSLPRQSNSMSDAVQI